MLSDRIFCPFLIKYGFFFERFHNVPVLNFTAICRADSGGRTNGSMDMTEILCALTDNANKCTSIKT